LFVGLFKTIAGEYRREYMAKRVRLPFSVNFRRLTGKLSSIIVASFGYLRRMQEELHGIVVPGSTPGRGFKAVVV